MKNIAETADLNRCLPKLSSWENVRSTKVTDMSTLKVNQIKSKVLLMFQEHLDLSDLSTSDKDRETKILTRCIAALAMHRESGCSPNDAAKAVWDGPDDNGIDEAFVDPSDSRIILAQSKWITSGSGEPSAADFGTFLK